MVYFILTDENNVCGNIKFKTGLNFVDKDTKYNIYHINYFNQFQIGKINNSERSCYYVRIVLCNKDTNIINDKLIDNKVVLSEKYYLFDPKIVKKMVKKFNLEVNERYIAWAGSKGEVQFLEWWKNSGLSLKYDNLSLVGASATNCINVLTWWLKSKLPLKYDRSALAIASIYCQLDVLTWWFKSNLPLKYDEKALNHASAHGNVHVLESWKNSGLELKYDECALEYASIKGHVEVLIWWFKSNLPLKYNKKALHETSSKGHINVLEWWFKSGLELKYDKNVINDYYLQKKITEEVYDWWKHSGLLN
jgi:hypothetical protein